MLGEISMGLSSLKAASDILKGLNAANTQTLINEAKIGLQGHILEAQQALLDAQETQTTLNKQIGNLENQIVQLKSWEAEKQRYELKDVGNGCLAYRLKSGMEKGEPPHDLCADCYTNGKKSMLQPEVRTPGMARVLVCHQCGAELYLVGQRQPEHSSSKRK